MEITKDKSGHIVITEVVEDGAAFNDGFLQVSVYIHYEVNAIPYECNISACIIIPYECNISACIITLVLFIYYSLVL